jgi:hypothetical protein
LVPGQQEAGQSGNGRKRQGLGPGEGVVQAA